MKKHSNPTFRSIALPALLLASAAAAQAGPRTSANYSIATATADSGGSRSNSASAVYQGSGIYESSMNPIFLCASAALRESLFTPISFLAQRRKGAKFSESGNPDFWANRYPGDCPIPEDTTATAVSATQGEIPHQRTAAPTTSSPAPP